MAAETIENPAQRPTYPKNEPQELGSGKTRRYYFGRFAALGSVLIPVVFSVGRLEMWREREEGRLADDRKLISDLIAEYDAIRPVLSSTMQAVFTPQVFNPDTFPPLYPGIDKIPGSTMKNDFLRALKGNLPDFLTSGIDPSTYPPHQWQIISDITKRVGQVETTNDRSKFAIAAPVLPDLGEALVIFLGYFEKDVKNLYRSSQVRFELDLSKSPNSLLTDPFSSVKQPNRLPQIELADGSKLDQTFVDPKILMKTVSQIVAAPPGSTVDYSPDPLIPRTGETNSFSLGIVARYLVNDKPIGAVSLSSLGNLLIVRDLPPSKILHL